MSDGKQQNMGRKPTVTVYVQPGTRSTKILSRYIAKNIDVINQYVFIELYKINKGNMAEVKKRGIKRTPTLVYGKKKIVSVERIMKILTPPSQRKDNFGYGKTSADEFIQDFQMGILDDESDEEDEFDPDNREAEIRQKMSMMQKRRPEMRGVSKKQRLNGGKKLHKRSPKKDAFDRGGRGDDEFRNMAGVDNIMETPTYGYMGEADGELLLEEYRNELADASGRKVGKNIRTRRR
jgi:hypothetical protein